MSITRKLRVAIHYAGSDAGEAAREAIIDTYRDLLEAVGIVSRCSPVEDALNALPDDAEVTLTFTAEDLREIRAAITKAGAR